MRDGRLEIDIHGHISDLQVQIVLLRLQPFQFGRHPRDRSFDLDHFIDFPGFFQQGEQAFPRFFQIFKTDLQIGDLLGDIIAGDGERTDRGVLACTRTDRPRCVVPNFHG